MEVLKMSENEIKSVVKKTIKEIIGNDLAYDIDNIGDNESLLMIGVNSLNVIKLIMRIEEEFDLEFEDEDIALKNWKDIKTIVDLIIRRKK